jgi:hypothetical protein
MARMIRRLDFDVRADAPLMHRRAAPKAGELCGVERLYREQRF